MRGDVPREERGKYNKESEVKVLITSTIKLRIQTTRDITLKPTSEILPRLYLFGFLVFLSFEIVVRKNQPPHYTKSSPQSSI